MCSLKFVTVLIDIFDKIPPVSQGKMNPLVKVRQLTKTRCKSIILVCGSDLENLRIRMEGYDCTGVIRFTDYLYSLVRLTLRVFLDKYLSFPMDLSLEIVRRAFTQDTPTP